MYKKGNVVVAEFDRDWKEGSIGTS
jgi:hypothetical protein